MTVKIEKEKISHFIEFALQGRIRKKNNDIFLDWKLCIFFSTFTKCYKYKLIKKTKIIMNFSLK